MSIGADASAPPFTWAHSMIYVTRKIEFDAGHRVLHHEGKCAHLHGHRYVAEITVSSTGLDSISRVVDFSVIKSLVGRWVDENWDHNILLHPDDPLLSSENHFEVFGSKRPWVMPQGKNPTAEVMAEVLLKKAKELLTDYSSLTVSKVRLYETPNCWAEVF